MKTRNDLFIYGYCDFKKRLICWLDIKTTNHFLRNKSRDLITISSNSEDKEFKKYLSWNKIDF